MSDLSNKKSIQVKLTDSSLKQLVADAIFKNESIREAFDGKKVSISADWHVYKWDDPDHFVTFTITEIE